MQARERYTGCELGPPGQDTHEGPDPIHEARSYGGG